LKLARIFVTVPRPGHREGTFWWWWCYPTPSERWGHGETPRRPNSRATPQGLDQRSKMEEVVTVGSLTRRPKRSLSSAKVPFLFSSQAATCYYQSNHSKVEAIPFKALLNTHKEHNK